jgi:hypothetical protein
LYDTSALLIDKELLRVKVMIALFQILVRILQQQNRNGSWGPMNSREETSYAIIALANLASLPFLTPIAGQIDLSISRGRHYLVSIDALDIPLARSDHIWAGKVAYGVESVCHSYVLAALSTHVPQYHLGPKVGALVNISPQNFVYFSKFFAKLPMFASVEPWRLNAWLIEGYLFLPDLESMRLFRREGMKEDKYLEYIPFTWIAPNELENAGASAETLFGMMTISLINFEVDEFFDGVLASHDLSTINRLRGRIEDLFRNDNTENESDSDGRQLQNYLRFVWTYPGIQNASDRDKAALQLQLSMLLLSHVQQCEDNIKLRSQIQQRFYDAPPSPYIRWVRTTASDHLSSQSAFAFMVCLLGSRSHYFPNSEISYIAQDCCSRTSAICRMYNDYGTLARDRTERNLNSVCFPEFDGEQKTDTELQKELLKLSMYEQKLLDLSVQQLERLCGTRHRRIYHMTKLFYNASRVYNEIYESRDISVSHS